MGKTNFMKKLLPIVLALMMVVSSMPLSFADPVIEPIGSVEAITPSQASFEDSVETIDGREVPVKAICFDSEFSLEWVEKNADGIQRPADGWWVGAKIYAPSLSLETLKTGKFYMHSSSGEWVEYSFADNRDSTDADSSQFIYVWSLLNESKLNQAVLNGKNVVTPLRFDWDGDNTIDQCINTVVVPSKVTLNKGGNTVYPTTGLAAVSALHTAPENLTITGSGTNYVTVRNNAYTLEWSKADDSIGRPIDAWWVGVQITAPEGMTDAQLASAKLSLKGSSGWQDGLSVLENLEHRNPDWFGLWLPVKESDTGEKSFPCRLDWNGDGVYEQMVDIVIDTDKLTLDKTNLYAQDKAAPVFTDMPEDATTYVGDDTVTLTGKVSDMGTKVGETTYTSGIKNAFYAVGSKDAAKHALALNENGEFSITVSEEFEGYYYFFATDNAGNESAETKVLVKHDVAIPTLEEVSLSNENWTKDDITITGKALDSLSGVNKVGYVKITEDDGIFADIDSVDKLTKAEDIDSQNQFELTVPADDYEGKIAVLAFDNVGRRSEAKVFSVKMDVTGVYFATASDTSNWTNQTQEITGEFSVHAAGIKTIQYKRDDKETFEIIPESDITFTGNPESRLNGSYKFSIPATEDDNHNYIILFTDNAGNEKQIEVTAHIDVTAPVVNETSAKVQPAGWTNQKVTISGECADELSGISSIQYKKETQDEFTTLDAENITFDDENQNGGSYTIELPADNYEGKYIIRFADKAGNTADATVDVKMDTKAPGSVEITYVNNPLEVILSLITFHFYQNNLTVKLEATDDISATEKVSGVESFTLSYKGNDDVVTENIEDVLNKNVTKNDEGFTDNGDGATYSFSIPAQFRGYVEAFATDAAGNSNQPTSHKESDTVINDTAAGEINASLSNPVQEKNDKKYYNATKDITVDVNISEENFMDGEFPDDVKTQDVVRTTILLTCVDTGSNFKKAYTVENWARSEATEKETWNGSFVIATSGEDRVPDGEYKLEISYTDLSGNVATTCTIDNFVIDTTAPVVEIEYQDEIIEPATQREGEGYFLNRTATVYVNEHNFDPEAFKATIEATNILGQAQSSAAQTALSNNLWQQDSENKDLYKLEIPYTDDAIYAFMLNALEDLAKNTYTTKAENDGSIFKKGTETPEIFTCDGTAMQVEITTKQSLAYRVLDAITFGFFDNVDVTFTLKDATSGLQKLTYRSKEVSGHKGTFGEADVKNADSFTDENGERIYTFTRTIDAEYKDCLEVKAYDKSGKETIVSTIKDAENEAYEGIIKDTTAPVVNGVEYTGSINQKDGKYYYNGDAVATFDIGEEYFFSKYYQDLATLKADKAAGNDNQATETLKNDVSLKIEKNTEPYGAEPNYELYYEGSAKPDAVTHLFTAQIKEKENEEDKNTITITIPADIDGQKNDGDYKITLAYKDLTGHSVEKTTEIMVIDTAAPVIEIEYQDEIINPATQREGEGYFLNRTAIITVNERNFDANDFNAIISSNNIQSDSTEEIDEIATKAKENLSTANWVSTGNTHILQIDYTDDAIYTFKLNSLIDIAKNAYTTKPENDGSIYKKGTETPEIFTCDETAMQVEITTKQSLAYRVLDAITFGFFNNVDVTFTLKDATSGLQKLTYRSKEISGHKGAFGETDVKNADSFTDENGERIYTFTRTIDAEYKDCLEVKAYDKSGKETVVSTIKDAENEAYEGIIKDTTAPVMNGVEYTGANKFGESFYYSGNAVAKFSITEDYFYQYYYNSLADLRADKDTGKTEKALNALKEDVHLEILKNVQPVGEEAQFKEYYTGNAAETGEKCTVVFDESGFIIVTIPAYIDGQKNDGDYIITLTYTDLADNSNSITTKVMSIDTIHPTVTEITTNNGNLKQKGDFDIVISAQDLTNANNNTYKASGLNELFVNINGTDVYTGSVNENYKYYVEYLLNGQNEKTIFDQVAEKRLSVEIIKNGTMKVNGQQVPWNDGRLVISSYVKDNALNKSETKKQVVEIDRTAPIITEFAFSSPDHFNHDKAKTDDFIEKNVELTPYGFYFKKDVTVTISAKDEAFTSEDGKIKEHYVSGVASITYYTVDKDGGKSELKTADVDANGQISFIVSANFKGQIYAYATDKLGNSPVYGNCANQYNPKTNSIYMNLIDNDGFVHPEGTIVESAQLHQETSSIEFSDKNTKKLKTYQADSNYRFSHARFSDIPTDQEMNQDQYINSTNRTPLYSSDPTINIKVKDSYSGIAQVEVWAAPKSIKTNKVVNLKKIDSLRIDNKLTEDSKAISTKNGTKYINSSEDKETETLWAVAFEKNTNLVNAVARNFTANDFGELDENDFTLVVVLTDRAGNQSYDYYTFGVDKTDPQISVKWNTDSSVKTYNNQPYFNVGRYATVTIKDKNINEIKDIQKVKEALIADNNVTNNKFGISTLYSFRDSNWKWHEKNAQQQFEPEIPGVSISPTYAVRSKGVDKDGNYTYTFTVNCKAEGDYLLNFACKDNSGNKTIFERDTKNNIHFTVDTTPPTVTYSINNTNVKNSKYFNSSRTATIVLKERNINVGDTTQCVLNNIVKTLKNNKSKVKIDWKPDKPNNTYTGTIHFDDEGDYVVDLRFTDFSNHTATVSKTGNTARVSGTAPLDFTIDKTKPELSFNVENTSYKNNQNVIVTVIDDNNDSVTPEQESYTFNKKTGKFEKSTKVIPTHKAGDGERTKITYQFMTVKNDGYYIINAKAVDKAGNEASAKQVVFTKNEHGSIFVLSDKLQKIVTSGYINSQQLSNLKKGQLTITEYNPDKFGFDENDPSAVSVAFKNSSSIKKGGISHTTPSRDSQAGWWSCTYTIDNSIFEKYNDGKYFINYISDSKTEQQKGCQFVLDTKSPTLSLSAKEVNDAINPESIAKDGLRVFNDKLNLTLILRDEVGFQLNSKGKSDIAYYFVDEDGNRVGDMHVVEFESGADSIDINVPISESDNIKNIVLIAKDAAGNTWTYKGLDDKLMENCKNNDLQYVFSYERGVLVTKNIFRQISYWIQTNVFQTILIGLGIVLVIAAAILIPIFVKRRKNEEDEPVTEEYDNEDDE